MSQVIGTNVASLNAQRNLSTSQGSLATALQRLSSGLRINSAKDDAAAAAMVDARGLLRLNVPYSFGLLEVAHLLPEFSRRHPAVEVDLGLNDRRVDLIEEGWDMAIRIGTLPDSTLQARRLAPARMLVCAAPAYLARHGTPTRIRDLEQHNCLRYTLSRLVGPDRWSFGPDGRSTVKVRGNLKASNGDALVAAAVAGQGIVYQPTFILAPHLRAGTLQALTLDQPPIDGGGIHAVYPADRKPPAKIRAMIDYLAGAFAPPPWDAGIGE